MIHYRISGGNPNRHFINVEVRTETRGQEKIIFRLPAWRPGRYELANYAQNIQTWRAYAQDGSPLHSMKLSKDTWEVNCHGTEEVVIQYNYYAYQLDAGASYYDEHQLYVNPVNCLLYVQEWINEPCTLKLEVPQEYRIATALHFDEEYVAHIQNFHHLADSPFIASAELQHREYEIAGHIFHIWIKGNARPNWPQILGDFTRFTEAQVELFGELPVKDYHFLFQLPNNKFYHGVEHLDSTVICLGPAFKLMDKELYNEFLGISSHELFHSWNIKSIRPVEMFPYDYSRENYSNLGYVAEGVTTYYGDLMLLRGGVFSWETFAFEVCKFLQRHFHNYGRLYQSLAESSFDTWLDGYKPGVPDRKVSMYVKGMIVAFMMDMGIRRDTLNTYSLDDIMRDLYYEFAKKDRGFSENDYLDLVSSRAGKPYGKFFEQYVWGLHPLEEHLQECLDYIGCELITRECPDVTENHFGFKLKEDQNKCVITQIAPGSPADQSMLSLNDEIIAVNTFQADTNNIDELLTFFEEDEAITLTIFRNKTLMQFRIRAGNDRYFPYYFIHKKKDADPQQKENFRLWTGIEF